MNNTFLKVLLSASILLSSFAMSDSVHARNKSDNFFEKTTSSASELASSLKHYKIERPLLVTSSQNLDNLNQSDRVGRLIGELVSSSFVNSGFLVQEIRLGQNITITNDGERILSRSLSKLQENHNADYVIVSTYSESLRQIYITIKAIRLSDGVIVASNSFVTPSPSR